MSDRSEASGRMFVLVLHGPAAAAERAFVFTVNPESTVDPAQIENLQALATQAGARV